MECSICLNPVCSDRYVTSCEHVFHRACMDSWFRTSHKPICPYCRTKQTLEDILHAPSRFLSVDANKCASCFERLSPDAPCYTTTCKHRFHPSCAQACYERTGDTGCPYCHKTHTVSQIEIGYARAGIAPWQTNNIVKK